MAKYKVEVKKQFLNEEVSDVYTLHALNPRKAVNRAKRKYRKKHSTAWTGVSGRVVAVWRWLPGWVR